MQNSCLIVKIGQNFPGCENVSAHIFFAQDFSQIDTSHPPCKTSNLWVKNCHIVQKMMQWLKNMTQKMTSEMSHWIYRQFVGSEIIHCTHKTQKRKTPSQMPPGVVAPFLSSQNIPASNQQTLKVRSNLNLVVWTNTHIWKHPQSYSLWGGTPNFFKVRNHLQHMPSSPLYVWSNLDPRFDQACFLAWPHAATEAARRSVKKNEIHLHSKMLYMA